MSKKCPVVLSDAAVGCFAKRFERNHSPRRDGSGFLCFVHRKYICLLKRYLYFIEIIIRCNFSMKKLKLESLGPGCSKAA